MSLDNTFNCENSHVSLPHNFEPILANHHRLIHLSFAKIGSKLSEIIRTIWSILHMGEMLNIIRSTITNNILKKNCECFLRLISSFIIVINQQDFHRTFLCRTILIIIHVMISIVTKLFFLCPIRRSLHTSSPNNSVHIFKT
jgi:hypothetical protein